MPLSFNAGVRDSLSNLAASLGAGRDKAAHDAFTVFDLGRVEAAEQRLGLRKLVQRAMTLGRLYGGGALIVGDGETDAAALARPLDEPLPRGGLRFLHVVSRWQLGASSLDGDPTSPWYGEPAGYELYAAGRAPLLLHPSRVGALPR